MKFQIWSFEKWNFKYEIFTPQNSKFNVLKFLLKNKKLCIWNYIILFVDALSSGFSPRDLDRDSHTFVFVIFLLNMLTYYIEICLLMARWVNSLMLGVSFIVPLLQFHVRMDVLYDI